MDLKSGYPFWAIKNGLPFVFPSLHDDAHCDVAIVGGGITGTLIAHELCTHGHDVVVLERRDLGWGSTAASTAMLQYEIDTHMVELARRFDEDFAARAYLACAEAIPRLQQIARGLRRADFTRTDSLYYASHPRIRQDLAQEFELRRKHGLPVEWLRRDAIRAEYGFDADCAILSHLGAWVDPYAFSVALSQRLQRDGVRVHDRAEVCDLSAHGRGVTLTLANGARVSAKRVVLAAGYETQRWLPQKVAQNHSSYACISDPLPDDAPLGRFADTMVWETARPYLYMRSTGDRRLVIGGEDDRIDVPARRDARVLKKAEKLQRRFAKLRPDLPITMAFAWAGTFAETEDGLPYFGPHPATGPRVLYAMAYGGNGITFSMAGAPLLRAWIEGRTHPLREIFGFERSDRR